MGFVKTPQELKKFEINSFDLFNAELLIVFWETKPEIIQNLLPPPLKPTIHPVAQAFIANYPETNFGMPYKEAALFLYAEYDGEIGMYCLSMPVDNDMAMARGREITGYPKKMATLHFQHEGKSTEGWVERNGKKFFQANVEGNNKLNDKNALKIAMELGLDPKNPGSIAYNYKFFRAPNYKMFDYNPRLIRAKTTMHTIDMQMGTAQLTLNHSKFDPWSEVEVVNILAGLYMKTNTQLLPGEVVAEISQEEFQPYSFYKIDPY
ncbi:MAG: acetoacetate decarboxylase [Promethearchaeota archaeon]|nr:MAG: acetoacetate decarboxylase [Candidatus Lokiarchaeota archaeon]